MRVAHRNLRVKRESVTLSDHVIGVYSLKLWDFNHRFPPGEGVPAVFEHPFKLVMSICYPQTSD
jgi:hypothetical protein